MRYDMNERSQMQGGKNWIFGSSETLIGWKSGKTNLCPMGPNGGSVAMDSEGEWLRRHST